MGLELKEIMVNNQKFKLAVEKFKNLLVPKEYITKPTQDVVSTEKYKGDHSKIEKMRARNQRNERRNLLKTTVEAYFRSTGYQNLDDYGSYVLENQSRKSRQRGSKSKLLSAHSFCKRDISELKTAQNSTSDLLNSASQKFSTTASRNKISKNSIQSNQAGGSFHSRRQSRIDKLS